MSQSDRERELAGALQAARAALMLNAHTSRPCQCDETCKAVDAIDAALAPPQEKGEGPHRNECASWYSGPAGSYPCNCTPPDPEPPKAQDPGTHAEVHHKGGPCDGSCAPEAQAPHPDPRTLEGEHREDEDAACRLEELRHKLVLPDGTPEEIAGGISEILDGLREARDQERAKLRVYEEGLAAAIASDKGLSLTAVIALARAAAGEPGDAETPVLEGWGSNPAFLEFCPECETGRGGHRPGCGAAGEGE